MNREIAKQNLLDIKKVLDGLKIKFWLHTGTLLGAIRDKSIISYDHDIDLRMKATDLPKMQIKKLESMRFKVRVVKPVYRGKLKLIKYFQMKRSDKTPINLAVMYLYKPEGLYITWPNNATNVNAVTPQKFYDGNYFTDFLGEKFRIPKNAEKFLVRFYKKDWRIPCNDKKTWAAGRWNISLDKYLKWFGKNEG